MVLLHSLAAILLLGILVTVHEFGHYIAARACGVAVPVFSIGWGPRAFGFRWRGTDFRVSWLPLGGYMRPAGGDPFAEGGFADDPPDLRPDELFMNRPPWQRAIIKAAGPAMNLVLPFFLFTALYLVGLPQPKAQLLEVGAGSVAEAAGIAPLDEIVAVNGAPVRTWVDVVEEFRAAPADPLVVSVERDGARRDLRLDLPEAAELPLEPSAYGLGMYAPDPTILVDDPASPVARAGLSTGDLILSVDGEPVRNFPELRAAFAAAQGGVEVRARRGDHEVDTRIEVGDWSGAATPADDPLWQRTGIASGTLGIHDFTADSTAARDAGLLPGDRVLQVNDTLVRKWIDVPRAVSKATVGEGSELIASTVTLKIRRAGVVQDVVVTPQVAKGTDDLGRYVWRAWLGIEFGGDTVAPEQIRRPYGPIDAVDHASTELVGVAGFMVERLGELVTLQAAPTKSLGGPIAMFRETKKAAEKGVLEWAHLMGLLSISLGIINLLPVPVFDGGDLLIYLAEWIRGRPLPRLLRERAQQFGIIFIAVLMVSVLVMDVTKLWTG